jgi:hypothetical protein
VRKEDVSDDLTQLAFEFFYWFSRFEFALKENGYLVSKTVGDRARPSWDGFVSAWRARYSISVEAVALLRAPPEVQVMAASEEIQWVRLRFDDCTSDLQQVVRALITVRNNLFHGGKHGNETWDSESRTRQLLTLCTAVLHQLAALADLDADYRQRY